MADIGERFMDALRTMDRERTVEPVLELFADDATLQRASQRGSHEGPDGVKRFWEEYLESTRELDTTFENVVRADGTIVLEWVSEGRLPNGDPLHYRGASILEVQDDSIQRFRTYYDSAAFVSAGTASSD